MGLGPGPSDHLTLGAWELLASGKPLKVREVGHEAAQAVLERGFRFERVTAKEASSIAAEVTHWAAQFEESIYAVPGHPLEAAETPFILSDATPAGIDVEVVPALTALERIPAWDDLTRSYAMTEGFRAGLAFMRLVQVMARLRGPDGCPWDREQTHSSLAVHLLEETYETLDAIDRDDAQALREELGDVLLQVVFHSEMARQEGIFEAAHVIEGLVSKLVDRHPHVFGDVVVGSARDVIVNWEAVKEAEKKDRADEMPKHLPALVYSSKILRRLARGGIEEQTSGEEIARLAASVIENPTEESAGELLYRIVALCAGAGIEPEGALRKRTSKAADSRKAPRG